MKAFDTETVNRPGAGYACLLIAGNGAEQKIRIFPKSWRDIFEFLAGDSYVCWNLTFDAQAIFHDEFLPYPLLERVAIEKSADWNGYHFEYIPTKEFSCFKGGRGFHLYDVRQFYNMSLREAAARYLPTERKGDVPKKWYTEIDRCLKDRRHVRIVDYARRDVKVTWMLWDYLRQNFERMGIVPDKWISPASLSVQFFKKELETIPEFSVDVQQAFERSFYGGRIEVNRLGKIGQGWLYDLHSAYPAQMALLPKLEKKNLTEVWSEAGEWVYNPATLFGAYYVEVEVPTDERWGPVAVEQKGDLIYPVGKFRTWMGRQALQEIRGAGFRHTVLKATEIDAIEKPTARLFPQIPALYLERKNPQISLAVKLVLNSLYGKLCERRRDMVINPVTRAQWHGFQKVRVKNGWGRHTCFPLAAAITEGTRMEVWRVLRMGGEQAIMAMTDSVLLDFKPKGLDGPGLGEWGEKTVVKEGVILGPGRYWLDTTDGKSEWALRGFNPSENNFLRMKRSKRKTVSIFDLRAKTLMEWTKQGGQSDLNVLASTVLQLGVEDTKRWWPEKLARVSDAWRKTIHGQPWIIYQREAKKNGKNSGRGRKGNRRTKGANAEPDRGHEKGPWREGHGASQGTNGRTR